MKDRDREIVEMLIGESCALDEWERAALTAMLAEIDHLKAALSKSQAEVGRLKQATTKVLKRWLEEEGDTAYKFARNFMIEVRNELEE